nr:Mpp10 protein domain containing protein [Haemonchus contortus]
MVSPSPSRITRAMRRAGVTTPKEEKTLEVVQEVPADDETDNRSAEFHDEPSLSERSSKTSDIVEQTQSLSAGERSLDQSDNNDSKPEVSSGVRTSPSKSCDILAEDSPIEKSMVEETAEGVKEASLALEPHKHHTTTAEESSSKECPVSSQKELSAQDGTTEEHLESGTSPLVQKPAELDASVAKDVGEMLPRRTSGKGSADDETRYQPESQPAQPTGSPVKGVSSTKLSPSKRSSGSASSQSLPEEAVAESLQKGGMPVIDESIATNTPDVVAFPEGKTDDEQLQECKTQCDGKSKRERTPEEVPAEDSRVETQQRISSPKQVLNQETECSVNFPGAFVANAQETRKMVDTVDGSLEHFPTTDGTARETSEKASGHETSRKQVRNDDQRPATHAKRISKPCDISQKGEPYVELESFKKLFKRPKFYRNAFERAVSRLLAHVYGVESRKSDLPVEFLNGDLEVLWQFVSHSGKQIIKEFRKREHLLEFDVHLKDDNSSDEGEEWNDEDEELSSEEEENEEEGRELPNSNEDLEDPQRCEVGKMGENGEQIESRSKVRKKYPKSTVDDEFFSLAEMSAFLDQQDRMEGSGPSVLDSICDSEAAPADYGYEDFFGSEDKVAKNELTNKKGHKKKRNADENELSNKKKKSVRFAIDDEDLEKDDGSEESAQECEPQMAQESVLLGDGEESEQPQSSLKKTLKRIKQTIAKLEQENLAPRSWQLSGEVTAQDREKDELLETHVNFDHGAKKAAEITEVFTQKLEHIIMQRVKDKAFDDVVPKKRIEERTESYRNQAIEEQEIVKTSLAEVYEKEYQKAAGEVGARNAVNEEHEVIEKRMHELFRLIDALSNFDYTPPEARPDVRVVSNMAALRVEEVGMSASTDAQLLAPEELKKRIRGEMKADEERDRTDKLRQRRKKKNRQRALAEVFGEEKVSENRKRKKCKETPGEGEVGGSEKMRSSTFFSKLQEAVRNEVKQKTTKKKIVKSEQVSGVASKYML